ncbi:MAG: alginate lyase family protein, partial [Myxococcota bacterium]|nr:alginate lyase family protein [Myxococcota bacterium]
MLLWLALIALDAHADTVVEDFEDVSDWSELQAEADTVLVGEGAGLWDDHETRTSIRRTFDEPLDASDAAFVSMLVWSQTATEAGLQWGFGSEDEDDEEGADYYSTEVTVDWTGWRYLKLALDEWTVARSPLGWDTLDGAWVYADGWGHTPDPDTVLVLDDLRIAQGIIETVDVTTGWSGDDHQHHWQIAVQGEADTTLSVLVLAPDDLPTAFSDPGTVTLDADGAGVLEAELWLDAELLDSLEPLQNWSVQVLLLDETGVRDGFDARVGVPLAPRDAPRFLLDAADVSAILDKADTEPWAQASLSTLLEDAETWVAEYEETYGTDGAQIPPEGGQWSQYYYCPDHDVSLDHEDGAHVCPTDGVEWTGWPYDEVIYTKRHADLSEGALLSALAWQLTGEDAHAEQAVEVLTGYAAIYGELQIHDKQDETSVSGGRVMAQTLDESGWLIRVAWAVDLLADSDAWTEEERAWVVRDVLRASAQTVARYDAEESNWQSWHNAAIGAVGLTLEDWALVADAVEGISGLEFQLDEGVLGDGLWHEGSWGYHFYALRPLTMLAEGAERAGLDSWSHPSLAPMFTLPATFAMPDGGLPAFNDSSAMSVTSWPGLYELAYARLGDADLLAPLDPDDRAIGSTGWPYQLGALLWGEATLPETADQARSSEVFEASGYAVLRATSAAGDQTYVALDFGDHGGWHGHYDKLGFVSFAQGQVMGLDPGYLSYALDTHTTWEKTSVAHNTVILDETSQAEATGALVDFVGGDHVSMARATGGEAYPGVSLDRTLVLAGDWMLDRFVVQSEAGTEHTVDWAYHQPGGLQVSLELDEVPSLAGSEGYQHLEAAASTTTDQTWTASWWTDFATDHGSTWCSDEAASASLTLQADTEDATDGSWVAVLGYDFTGAEDDAYVIYTLDLPDDLPTDEAP